MFKKINFLIYNLKNKIIIPFLNLVFNKKCVICSCAKTNENLCKTCLKEIKFLTTFPHRIFNNVPIFSATFYKGNIKTLIQGLKFKNKKRNASALAEILFFYFNKLNIDKDFIVVYPPTHFLRVFKRGYNHCYLIARAFCNLGNLTLENKLFKKIKRTKPQYSVKNRHKNIKDSFNINLEILEKIKKDKNKTILIIDDITTSGATLEELINLLSKNDFNNIICLTVSKSNK